MMRLFTALPVPDPVADALTLLQGGLPGARWQKRENYHLTLRFIGEVDGRSAADIDDALATIRAPAFTLELHGTGIFGKRDPSQLWAGVRPSPALMHLQKKVDAALQRVGIQADRKSFTPHVTLAKLKAPPREKLMGYLAAHALFSSAAFAVDRFCLYQSLLSQEGSHYTLQRDYPLDAPEA